MGRFAADASVAGTGPDEVRLRALFWPASLVTGAGARLADRARRLGRLDRFRRPRAA